jgi:hypothetical protein
MKGVLRIACSRAPRTKGRKVASKKHAEAPLQRAGRQKGHKQTPGCGGARELRPQFFVGTMAAEGLSRGAEITVSPPSASQRALFNSRKFAN